MSWDSVSYPGTVTAARMPGTTNDFGGSSVTEYRDLLALFYPTVVNGLPAAQYKYEDFHQTLSYNPCG